MKNFSFPVIKKVEIKNFSLYKKRSHIVIDLNKGVFCLAGANGLGKSTFINILNYGLTGIVKRPDSDFSQYGSIPQFYSKSKTFASNYFDRRIEENFRDVATVSVQFEVGSSSFNVTRNFFDQDTLVALEIVEDGDLFLVPENSTGPDLDRFYKAKLTKCIGLGDFDQFVFLQFFVFTFDETHQLLFWDNSLMERVLYLFFNLDPGKAKLADQLRKEITASESNMRNLQWDATQKEKELTSLLNQVESATAEKEVVPEDTMNAYQDLANGLTEKLELIQKIEGEVKECDLALSDYSLRTSTLKNEYDVLFSSSFKQEVSLEKDPQVIGLLLNIRNKVCSGEDSTEYFEELKKLIWETKCPNNLPTTSQSHVAELQKIDEAIYQNTIEQEKLIKRKNRLLDEYKQLRNEANAIKASMEKIEHANENFVLRLYKNSATSEMSVVVSNMRSQIDRVLQIKAEESRKRDEKKVELRKLEKELNQRYLTAEETFMPIFIEYARNFLGLDVDINLQTYSKGATLILEVNDSERREKYQLSESQRYFIDIALRMALVEYSARSAAMLIDTPEGSLDIAYESKAGKMFADFTKKGYDLLMTANINSSMLLLQLAEQCGAQGMKLEKMTDWTILSEVQQQEQQHIDEAFNKIEDKLK